MALGPGPNQEGGGVRDTMVSFLGRVLGRFAPCCCQGSSRVGLRPRLSKWRSTMPILEWQVSFRERGDWHFRTHMNGVWVSPLVDFLKFWWFGGVATFTNPLDLHRDNENAVRFGLAFGGRRAWR